MSENRAIEELAALIDGDLPTLETTVGVRPLASLAVAVAEHVTVAEPDPQFRGRLRTQLMEQVEAASVPRRRRQRRAI